MAVLLSSGKCLGTVDLALEQASCLPCGFPDQQLAAVVGEEASPGGRKVLCLWRKGLTSKHLLLAAVLSFTTLDNKGICATQRLHGKKLLLCFAPAEFQRKALGKPKGKCGEDGDAGVCISHLSRTKV